MHVHFGRSLCPALLEHVYPLRDFACCEGGRLPEDIHCDEYHDFAGGAPESFVYHPKMKAQSDADSHAKGIMLRGDRYKYIERITGENELYDLETDPKKTHNLIGGPAMEGVVMQMQRDMLRWLMQTSDIVPYERDRRWAKEAMMLRARRCIALEKIDDLERDLDSGVPFSQALARYGGTMR